MPRAGSYNLIRDFQPSDVDGGYAVMDPYWILAVYRLGQPLSFNRKEMASGTKDLSQGALLRAQKPLVITDDCFHVSVSNPKSSHTKTLTASLKQTDVNFLVEILPDDWIFCWLLNNREDYEDLLDRIDAGDATDPCNKFSDGLKFVGRVDDIYKDVSVDPGHGTKTSQYSLRCTGFRELDTQFFYDHSLASKDVLQKDIGMWLTRLGVNVEAIFGQNAARGIEQDNINRIIPTMLNLIVGQGPDPDANINVDAPRGKQITATPTVQNRSPAADATSAPYAYMVPVSVGAVLGKGGGSKAAGVMGYADVLELLMGVQSYSAKSGYQVFVPDLKQAVLANRHLTPFSLMGTFLPYMPDFANRPLWSVFQQYLNPTINEMYTCLRVNPDGFVVPTMVVRQIPFTTDAFTMPTENEDPNAGVDAISGGSLTPSFDSQKVGHFHTTKFLDLPRWDIPSTMVRHVHVGRSNATRVNFIHIYGQSSYLSASNVPIQAQMLENPPVRDDLDIMRSGLRPYMATVECWVDDQVGRVPSQWIRLVADWMVGSHLTLNGTMELYGVQAPICEGDNIAFDGVVYHIMSVSHSASINGSNGVKSWITQLELVNGMRDIDAAVPASTENDVSIGLQPIYPGFSKQDNRSLDPGLTLEQHLTTGGDTERKPNWDDLDNQTNRDQKSQLNPSGNAQVVPRGQKDEA